MDGWIEESLLGIGNGLSSICGSGADCDEFFNAAFSSSEFGSFDSTVLESAPLASGFSTGVLCLPVPEVGLTDGFAGSAGSSLSRPDELQQLKNEKNLDDAFGFPSGFEPSSVPADMVLGFVSVTVSAGCPRWDRRLLVLLPSRRFFEALVSEMRDTLPRSSCEADGAVFDDSRRFALDDEREGIRKKDLFFFGGSAKALVSFVEDFCDGFLSSDPSATDWSVATFLLVDGSFNNGEAEP